MHPAVVVRVRHGARDEDATVAAPLELLALHHVEASVEAAQSDVARLPQSLPYNWFVVVAVDALVQGQAELVAALDGGLAW